MKINFYIKAKKLIQKIKYEQWSEIIVVKENHRVK